MFIVQLQITLRKSQWRPVSQESEEKNLEWKNQIGFIIVQIAYYSYNAHQLRKVDEARHFSHMPIKTELQVLEKIFRLNF